MSLTGFAAALVLGAGVIALWITVRFPKLMPNRWSRIALHLGFAIVLAHLVVPFGIVLPVSASPAVQLMAGIFAVALPVLVYTLVSAIWLIRLAQNALGGMLR
jgi:hypothetical protein